jgi:hypothetical protein
MRSASLSALQRTHCMDGKTGDRGQFFLRKTRGFAERLELRAE